MSRLPHPPTTRLGVALRSKRADQSQADAAEEANVPRFTLSRIERGAHRPTYDTAKALATWLGWSVDEVMTAAETPVEPPEEAQP
jgi:DNA-binding XRE family transcriptional regulator